MDKEQAIRILCFELDMKVYLPVKEELKNCDCQYSLGARKEKFKEVIETIINDIEGEDDEEYCEDGGEVKEGGELPNIKQGAFERDDNGKTKYVGD